MTIIKVSEKKKKLFSQQVTNVIYNLQAGCAGCAKCCAVSDNCINELVNILKTTTKATGSVQSVHTKETQKRKRQLKPYPARRPEGLHFTCRLPRRAAGMSRGRPSTAANNSPLCCWKFGRRGTMTQRKKRQKKDEEDRLC